MYNTEALAKIKTEITTDPAAMGYAGKDAATLITLLKTPWSGGAVVNSTIERKSILAVLIQLNQFAGIMGSADPVAKAAQFFLTHPDFASIDLLDVRVQTLLGGLKTLGLITDASIAALMSLVQHQTREAVLGLDISVQDLEAALAS